MDNRVIYVVIGDIHVGKKDDRNDNNDNNDNFNHNNNIIII